jgi:hypothetical protein
MNDLADNDGYIKVWFKIPVNINSSFQDMMIPVQEQAR